MREYFFLLKWHEDNRKSQNNLIREKVFIEILYIFFVIKMNGMIILSWRKPSLLVLFPLIGESIFHWECDPLNLFMLFEHFGQKNMFFEFKVLGLIKISCSVLLCYPEDKPNQGNILNKIGITWVIYPFYPIGFELNFVLWVMITFGN